MNKGLSNSNRLFLPRRSSAINPISRQRIVKNGLANVVASNTVSKHIAAYKVAPSVYRWVQTLCFASLVSIALPTQAQEWQLQQAATEIDQPQKALTQTAQVQTAQVQLVPAQLAQVQLAQVQTAQAQESLPMLPPAEQTAPPTNGTSAQPTLSLPDSSPAQPTGQPEPFSNGSENFDAQTQIPTLPPPTGPQYERSLTIPNTVITPTNLQPAFDDYHLGPGDAFFVSVQRYPDLSFQATLDLQGNVVVPIQGAVPFKGLTLGEAEDRLRSIYNQYVVIREPRDVAVTLVSQRGVEVTILGSVQRPGFYPLTDPSVATALLTAGGATRMSDLRAIQVQRRLRRNGGFVEETVNVDLFTPLKEGSSLPDVRLEDGDVVIVPELDPNQLDEYDRYLVARSTLAQPIINVRFLNYAGGRGGLGTLNLNNGSTFVDGVAQLGISIDDANLGEVALIRFDPETGRAVTLRLDAKAAIEGDITQNPPLEDSDVIVVGRNFIGRLSFAIQTIARPFRDVLGFTNFFNDFLDGRLDRGRF